MVYECPKLLNWLPFRLDSKNKQKLKIRIKRSKHTSHFSTSSSSPFKPQRISTITNLITEQRLYFLHFLVYTPFTPCECNDSLTSKVHTIHKVPIRNYTFLKWFTKFVFLTKTCKTLYLIELKGKKSKLRLGGCVDYVCLIFKPYGHLKSMLIGKVWFHNFGEH